MIQYSTLWWTLGFGLSAIGVLRYIYVLVKNRRKVKQAQKFPELFPQTAAKESIKNNTVKDSQHFDLSDFK